MPHTFDLLTAPWLPCRARDGTVLELGLRETLARSPELVDLSAATPVTQAALLRLLLAVLHAALDGPRSVTEVVPVWQAGALPADRLDRYFAQWSDRFDLFSAARPFWQDPGLELPTPDTVARLAPELASGNNVLLFDHTRDDDPPAVPPAVAARWLVTHQLFGLGGGKGPRSNKYQHPYASHAPAVTGVNVFLRGDNLFQTLLLNLTVLSDDDRSRPIWERDFPTPEPWAATGWLEKLTWPNRAARLLPTDTDGGVVVRQVYTAQGAVLQDSGLRDPYFAMRVPRGKDDPGGPLRISAGRALWRDSTALLGFSAPDTRSGPVPRPPIFDTAGRLLGLVRPAHTAIPCCAVGLDFNQSKINLWRQDELTLPLAFLPSDDATELQRAKDLVGELEGALKTAEERATALYAALRTMAEALLKPASEQERADPKQVSALLANWHGDDRYWAALDRPFANLLRGLPTARDEALAAWQQACGRAAGKAFDEIRDHLGGSARALRAAVKGRGRVLPNWTLPPKKQKGATP